MIPVTVYLYKPHSFVWIESATIEWRGAKLRVKLQDFLSDFNDGVARGTDLMVSLMQRRSGIAEEVNQLGDLVYVCPQLL